MVMWPSSVARNMKWMITYNDRIEWYIESKTLRPTAPSSNLSYLYQSLCYVSQIGKWGFINYACTYHNAFLLKRYVVNILSIIKGVKVNKLIYFSSSFSSNVYLIKWGGYLIWHCSKYNDQIMESRKMEIELPVAHFEFRIKKEMNNERWISRETYWTIDF